MMHARLAETGFSAAKATCASTGSVKAKISLSLACTLTTSLRPGRMQQQSMDLFFTSLASLSIKDLGRFITILSMRVALNDDGGYTFIQEEALPI